MKSTIDNTLCLQAAIFDSMKPVTRKILTRCFLWFENERRCGRYRDVFPSLRKIAEMAQCSVASVKTSLNEIDEKFDGLVLKRNSKVGKRSNHYIINEKTFEFLFLLKSCRLDHAWKKVRLDVLRELSEDELYFAKRLYRKGELSTTKLATSELQKLATIKSFLLFNSRLNEIRTEESRTRVMNKPKNPRKEEGLITDLPMSDEDKKWISENYAFVDIRKARLDADVYRFKWGKTIDNMGAFINSQALKSAKQRYRG